MRRIVGGVTNRVFVGPACRDQALMDASTKYALDVPIASILLRVLPNLLKPFLAPLITLPARLHTHQHYQALKPTIEYRLKEFDARRADPEVAQSLGPEPNDWLQWSIAQAKELGDPVLYSAKKLAHRVLFLNLPSIHTTSLAITGTLLDLVCHNKPKHVAELRTEITSVLAKNDDQWNKHSLAKMHKLDSTLRESVRSLTTVALSRKVTSPSGVTFPSGVHVPYGVTVMVPGHSVMHDKTIYGPDADQFNPFRFVDRSPESRKAFATTSKEFLSFGHGRYACPGRFFASTELKVIIQVICF